MNKAIGKKYTPYAKEILPMATAVLELPLGKVQGNPAYTLMTTTMDKSSTRAIVFDLQPKTSY